MAILIDVFLGNHAAVFDDLVQIARCDSGLLTVQPTEFVLQVTYTQKQQSVASSSRLLSLAYAPVNILIIGVGSTFVVPGGTKPITAYTGGVCLPGSVVEPITIYLDVTDAGGQFYFVNDAQGQTIYEPRPVILYHELAHAFHMIQGDQPTIAGNETATDKAREVQAVQDENTFRSQIGITLRHPSDHIGGVGAPSHGGVAFPECKPVYPGFNWDCIVASAAVGSPYAPRVEALRRARREYRNLSLWSALIAEPVLAAYRKFSPAVVRDMHAVPALRHAMLLFAVQPIFHLVQMSEVYLETDSDTPELMADLDRSVDGYIADAAGSASMLADAAKAAALAARALASDRVPAAVPLDQRVMPAELFDYLAGAIASKGGGALGFAWAFEGIAVFLEHAAARRADGVPVTAEFLSGLDAWLARVPIPPDARLNIADAPAELSVLGQRVFTRASTRELFAEHLLARWPEPSVAMLQTLLRDLSYIPER